jgi:hypothetical protein
VLARSKTGAGRIRRNREGRRERGVGRDQASTLTSDAAVTTQTTTAAMRRRREAGISQDAAMYTCSCGFVFKALVSTSVDCPHCGGAQAW